MPNKDNLTRGNIVDYLADIFNRRGSETYLGETITMTEHMLQTALNAENAGESSTLVVSALLHDIGHYTGEFPDDYIEQGVDNRHEYTGAAILEQFFPIEFTAPVRGHVNAKRYLCAVEPDYFAWLSDASVKTLELQGGSFDPIQVAEYEKNPHLNNTIKIRRYDDNGKVPGVITPNIDHYLKIVQQVLDAIQA